MKNYIGMINDKDVLGHIRKKNEARRAAWNGKGMLFTIPEDLADRYHNVYEYEFEMAFATYSDLFKEVHGRRPRTYPMDWHLSDIEAAIDELGK